MGKKHAVGNASTFLILRLCHNSKKKKDFNLVLASKESKDPDPVLFHPIPLLEIFLFFEIWHFLIKSSDFGDWAHQGGFLC